MMTQPNTPTTPQRPSLTTATMSPSELLLPEAIATTNPGKLAEARAILGTQIKGMRLEVPEVQPESFERDLMRKGEYEQVARRITEEKAKAAYRANGCTPVMVEETALFFDGLEGQPGPLIAHFVSPMWLKALCSLTHANGNIKATVYVTYGIFNGREALTRVGTVSGEIASAPRGTNGFGWDSIFVPEPERQREVVREKGNAGGSVSDGVPPRTYGEMTLEEKTEYSARARALNVVLQEPFRLPARPAVVTLTPALKEAYISDMKTQVGEAQIQQMSALQRERYRKWNDHIRAVLADPQGEQQLLETGELPVTTPFDYLKGPLDPLREDEMVRALTERHFDGERLTHPAILEAQLALESRGFLPLPGKKLEVFDRLTAAKRLNSFDDFALIPQEARIGEEMDERTLAVHAAGLFTFTNRRFTTPITNGSSMHAVIGAFSMATMAIAGAMSFAPADSKWKGTGPLITMIRRAKSLIASDPIVTQHMHGERILSNGVKLADWLVTRAHRCIGATLKPNPAEAVKLVAALLKEDVRLFRVYDAGSTNELYHTVRALRESYGESITILAGQVLGAEQAGLLAQLGADGLIVGIGDGEMCSTSTKADISGDNAKRGYHIVASGVGIPLIFDGGVGNKVGVALAIGAAGRLSSRSLIGGTIEQPPFWWFKGPHGPAKNYGGEAAPSTKIGGGNVDYLGRPFNVEGIDGWVDYDGDAPSIFVRMMRMNQALAKALRFQRLVAAEELQHQYAPAVGELSANAAKAAAPHHQH